MSALRSTVSARSGANATKAARVRSLQVSIRRTARCQRLVVRSQQQDDDSNSNVDWDAAWTQFQKQMRSQVSSNVQTKTTERPSANPRLDAIRKQERLALDVWSSQWFPVIGGSLAVILLFVFVFGVGPPPAELDPRCTLPWC